MTTALVHPTTLHQLVALKQSLPHAILIHGHKGTGKKAIADEFVQLVVANKPQNTLKIAPEDGSIGIEQIRSIRNFVKRVVAGKKTVRRVILITDAHLMTIEAQNALLKTLEEPPKDTLVILTADDPTALRSTIRSRCQQLLVLPVSAEQTLEFYKSSEYTQPKVLSAYYMADGCAELTAAILSEDANHETVQTITTAKELLKKPVYERLLLVDSYVKDKDTLKNILLGLERVVISGLRQQADKNNATAVKKFYKISQQIEKAKLSLGGNGNPKLILTNLLINL